VPHTPVAFTPTRSGVCGFRVNFIPNLLHFSRHSWQSDDNRHIRRGAIMSIVSDSVIVQDPEIHSGEPVFGGTRVPFQTLLDYLEGEKR
jgi:hypothetical protein